MLNADIVVVGGGVTGIAAALTAHRSGFDVLMVTEQPLRESPVGEPLQSIHPGADSLFEQLGLQHAFNCASKGIYKSIKVGESKMPFSITEGACAGNHISRFLLNHESMKVVVDNGIRVLSGSRVIGLENRNKITHLRLADGNLVCSRYVIDASGKNSPFHRMLELRRLIFSPPFFVHSYVGEDILNGYDKDIAYFIPNTSGWSWLAFGKDGTHTWTRLQVKEAGKMTGLKKETTTYHQRDHIANLQWQLRTPLFRSKVILAGDSAGIIDPAAGQGILNGVLSGMMAAQTACGCLETSTKADQFLLAYENWFSVQYLKKVDALRVRYGQLGINI